MQEEDDIPMLTEIAYWIARKLPFGIQGLFEDEMVKLKQVSAFYLPIWVIDAVLKMEAKGSKGEADTTSECAHAACDRC